MAFELHLECGKCSRKIISAEQTTLLQFAFCGCPNKARMALQNLKEGAYLLGAEDEASAFVSIVLPLKQKRLPPMSLVRWNQLQYRFKTQGALLKTAPGSAAASASSAPSATAASVAQ